MNLVFEGRQVPGVEEMIEGQPVVSVSWFLVVMSVAQDIGVVSDLFGIVDESHVRVLHDM